MVVGIWSDDQADRIFGALADGTRRDILIRVMAGEWSISELSREYPMSFAAIQKHVAVLERAGLVVKQKHGREQLVSTDIETVRRARFLLDQVEALWEQRMERFESLLEHEQGES